MCEHDVLVTLTFFPAIFLALVLYLQYVTAETLSYERSTS